MNSHRRLMLIFLVTLSLLAGAASAASCPAPRMPTRLLATTVDSGSIKLAWRQAASRTVTHYVLYRNRSQIATISHPSQSFVDAGLRPRTRYSYLVRAVNSCGGSALSQPVTATTPSDNTLPTPTPSVTVSPTPRPVATVTPTVVPIATATPTPTVTPTVTPRSPTPTASATVTPVPVQGNAGGAPLDFDSEGHMQQRTALRNLPPQSTANATSHCQNAAFPPAWTWSATPEHSAPAPATTGTALIKQVRNGQVIATYDKLGISGCFQPENNHLSPDPACGAFPRGFGRNWQEGDMFEVYPAVYAGDDQQIYLGPAFGTHAQFATGVPTVPRNIIIRGITVDGKRPVLRLTATGASNNTLGQSLVYLDRSETIVIENIDVDGGTSGSVGKAGVYINGAHNLTLRNLRVHGFKHAKANGLFGTNNNTGLLELGGLILFDNGGDAGPEHNAYLNASSSDPGFAVWLHGSHSTDIYYGHAFKSRAQVNLIEGNYFQGIRSTGVQTENYLLDLPEGGRALVRNNIFVKNASGPNSNAMSLTYALEGIHDGRALSLVVEHNTFVALATTYDGSHPLFPIATPYSVSGQTLSAPFTKLSVNGNAYVGYCTQGNANMDFRGDAALLGGFDDLRQDYTLANPSSSGNPLIVGTLRYVHQAAERQRTGSTLGAQD